MSSTQKVLQHLRELSSRIDPAARNLAIILAAGHGKRIKSATSKMLHEIWGEPTVVRVADAAAGGLESKEQVIVVGIKALEVSQTVGPGKGRSYTFQAEQNGTGDAVRVALDQIPPDFNGDIYVFPGDIGLITAKDVHKFNVDFIESQGDMMVLTGRYEGPPNENYYGRILRVPARDIEGSASETDQGKVIEIKEHKDILALKAKERYEVEFNARIYGFTRDELIENREFNTGIFAFKGDKLRKYIGNIDTDNVQGEHYLTDLISIFNDAGLTVNGSVASDNRSVLGFNTKSVLCEMENHARERVYELLKDVITISDCSDFFIADDVMQHILDLDKKAAPLDIVIGKGAYLGKGVRIAKQVHIGKNAHLIGNIALAEGVCIHDSAHLSSLSGQSIKIDKEAEIGRDCILAGNVAVGKTSRIDSGVRITGSAEQPTHIGENVAINGISQIIDSVIENGSVIENSIIKNKHVRRLLDKSGLVRPVRYVFPEPEGTDGLEEIN